MTACDKNKNTALHWACLKKHCHAALLLLEYRDIASDVVNMTNTEGKTWVAACLFIADTNAALVSFQAPSSGGEKRIGGGHLQAPKDRRFRPVRGSGRLDARVVLRPEFAGRTLPIADLEELLAVEQ